MKPKAKDQRPKAKSQTVQQMKDTSFTKLVLFINSLVPLTLLLWDWYHNNVGANPLEFVTRTTGMLTLIFLLISLAVTPARKITRGELAGEISSDARAFLLLLWLPSFDDLRLV